MSILTKLTDLLYPKQKLIELLAIFLFFSLVLFKWNNNKITLFWNDYPFIVIFLSLLTTLLVIIWLKIEKQKTELLIKNIQKDNLEKPNDLQKNLINLSLRQKEVFDLIVKGKSNKEIMAALDIELSTLKTHINQIYKVLEIKNRKEARNYQNDLNTAN